MTLEECKELQAISFPLRKSYWTVPIAHPHGRPAGLPLALITADLLEETAAEEPVPLAAAPLEEGPVTVLAVAVLLEEGLVTVAAAALLEGEVADHRFGRENWNKTWNS